MFYFELEIFLVYINLHFRFYSLEVNYQWCGTSVSCYYDDGDDGDPGGDVC